MKKHSLAEIGHFEKRTPGDPVIAIC
jgi:hypothetical protein